ncbi:MAG: hypothetical protein KIS68_16035 [Bauldia sp.]|nr:hypothetical protein [Bauldia sp.]
MDARLPPFVMMGAQAAAQEVPLYLFMNAEAEAVVTAMAMQPNNARKLLIDTFVGALKAAGVWSKIDAMWVLAAHDEQAARLNWKSPGTFTLTRVNGPTFMTDRGFAGDGSTSYLDTGWDASNDGVQLTQNDAHISSYQRNSSGNTFAAFVQQTNGSRLGVMNRATANQDKVNVNSTTAIPSSSTVGSHPQHMLGRRNDGTNASAVRDGVSMGAPEAATSSSPLSTDLSFGKAGTLYMSSQMAGGSVGAYLDDTEALAFYNAWRDYMVAVGADT